MINKSHVVLLLMLISIPGWTAFITAPSHFWQCTIEDNTSKKWTVRNSYQKMALNRALDACKKESTLPLSCKASLDDCQEFNHGLSMQPAWRCTALDATAASWQSNSHRNREDAALAAKAFCKNKSSVPATCYIHMITCMNSSEGLW